MTVYLVLEEDRDFSTTVVAAFTSLEGAFAYLNGPNGSNCYLESTEGIEVRA